MGNKYNCYENAYSRLEDRILVEARRRGIKYIDIEKYYIPWRTAKGMCHRYSKLTSKNKGRKEPQEKIYYVKPGLEGLFFKMPKPNQEDEYIRTGAGQSHIMGMTIYT